MCFTLQTKKISSLCNYILAGKKETILHIFKKYLIHTSTFIFVLQSYLFYFLCILMLKFLDFCGVLLVVYRKVLLYFIHGLFVSLLDTFAFTCEKLSTLLRITLKSAHTFVILFAPFRIFISFIKQKII